jgi:hypothetical protein
LLQNKKTDQEIVDSFFSAALLRCPATAENEQALKHLKAGKNREEACRDLLWVLINSKEFQQIHLPGSDTAQVLEFVNGISKGWEKK